jgi:ABC-type Fe3+/spermidine/putrescine transport system ATPase subunit
MYHHGQALLEIRNVSKSFGATPVLHDVSFDVDRGEIVCLLGPSGCGKTTLLRIIAGLEQAGAGQVLFARRDLLETPVHQRSFGLMFQDFVLFPHRNVYDNVAFGLRMAQHSKAAIQQRVAEMLELVGLTGYEARRVHELSGGQQQRVALARSLAPRPALLLLDEPLGSLDRTLREDLMEELRRILKHAPVGPDAPAGITSIYVTHDQQEAFAIADRVVVMNAGRIEQVGPPLVVYRQPANPFVARFLGMHNLLPGHVAAVAPDLWVSTALGNLRCGRCVARVAVGDSVLVLIPPDAASLASSTLGETQNLVHGQLLGVSFRGSQVKVTLGYAPEAHLVFDLPGSAADDLPQPGQPLRLALDPDGLSLLVTG